jgi:hypothetical protein
MGRAGFVRRLTRRTVVRRAFAALVFTVLGVLAIGVLGRDPALADTSAVPGAPLAGSTSGTLSQVNAGTWTTTVYLDTSALCAGTNPAGNKFSLVTGKPNTVTGAATPQYPNGPLSCGRPDVRAVTEVKLTFTPSPALSAVPLTAALVVTPPQALLLAGDPPLQVPLTVRRTVSPWQYVGIPAICGAALATALLVALMMIGVPARRAGQPVPPEPASAPPKQPARAPEPGPPDFGSLLLLYLMTKRHEVLVTELPVAGELTAGAKLTTDGRLAVPRTQVAALPRPVDGALPATVSWPPARTRLPAPTQLPARTRLPAGADQPVKRVRWGLEFWRTPLFAGAAWSFGDSWATSVTPLTALAGGVLTASGAVSGLVPGVDLTRFGLLMVLVGALTTFAPLLFGAINSLFPAKNVGAAAPAGDVVAARLWVMLLASCLTVFAIGAEIGFVGLVLGFDLIVVSPSVRWIGPAAAGLAAVLFLAYGAHSILILTGEPSGQPKMTAKTHSFMI